MSLLCVRLSGVWQVSKTTMKNLKMSKNGALRKVGPQRCLAESFYNSTSGQALGC